MKEKRYSFRGRTSPTSCYTQIADSDKLDFITKLFEYSQRRHKNNGGVFYVYDTLLDKVILPTDKGEAP